MGKSFYTTTLSLAKWENKLHDIARVYTHKNYIRGETQDQYKKTVSRKKQKFTGRKISVRNLRQIVPRGGGAFLETRTGNGTFSSGTGFLGSDGTLKTLCSFRTSVLSHQSPAQNTDIHPQCTHITKLTKSSFASEYNILKIVLGKTERQYL